MRPSIMITWLIVSSGVLTALGFWRLRHPYHPIVESVFEHQLGELEGYLTGTNGQVFSPGTLRRLLRKRWLTRAASNLVFGISFVLIVNITIVNGFPAKWDDSRQRAWTILALAAPFVWLGMRTWFGGLARGYLEGFAIGYKRGFSSRTPIMEAPTDEDLLHECAVLVHEAHGGIERDPSLCNHANCQIIRRLIFNARHPL
jgi:hypothetical protein